MYVPTIIIAEYAMKNLGVLQVEGLHTFSLTQKSLPTKERKLN